MNTNSHQFQVFEKIPPLKSGHLRSQPSRIKALARISAVLLMISGSYYLGALSVSQPGSKHHKWSPGRNFLSTYSPIRSPSSRDTTRRRGFNLCWPKIKKSYKNLFRTTPRLHNTKEDELLVKYLGPDEHRFPIDALLVAVEAVKKAETELEEETRDYPIIVKTKGTIRLAVIKSPKGDDNEEDIALFKTDYFRLGSYFSYNSLIKDAEVLRALREDDDTNLFICAIGNVLPGCDLTEEKCFPVLDGPYEDASVKSDKLVFGNGMMIWFQNFDDPEHCTLEGTFGEVQAVQTEEESGIRNGFN